MIPNHISTNLPLSNTMIHSRTPNDKISEQQEHKNSIFVNSKEDLIEQMNAIHLVLDNVENEWEDRVKSMEKLQNICLGNATKDRELLNTFIEKLIEHRGSLSKQVK